MTVPTTQGVTVELWTDGAVTGNGKPESVGGWAYVLLAKQNDQVIRRSEASGRVSGTTNNRMELTAVIEGLRALTKPSAVSVYSDSAYVVNAYGQGWVKSWKSLGWKRRSRNRLVDPENLDLWKALDELVEHHRVSFRLIRGHSGVALNEYCDRLAVAARGDSA